MQSNLYTQYEYYELKKNYLLTLSAELDAICEKIDANEIRVSLQKETQQIKSNSFKVLVIGEFKRGKSTLVNALLGEKILPAFSTPCTAVISEIKHNENKFANIHIKPNVDVNLLPSDANQPHLYPRKVNVDEIEKYVTIQYSSDNQKMSTAASPYSLVEIFWPIELCKNGVSIIDSPGLNENKTRTEITTNYVSEADAIIFVMLSTAVASESEMEAIKRIKETNRQNMNIFYIINRWDEIKDEKEKNIVKTFSLNKLSSETKFGEKGIFFVSAFQALNAKIQKNEADLVNSGLYEFEKKLADFLTQQKGIQKIDMNLQQLRDRSIEISHFIKTQKQNLKTSGDLQKNKYTEALNLLESQKSKFELVIKSLKTSRLQLLDEIQMHLQIQFINVLNHLKTNIDKIEVQQSFEILSPNESSKNISEETLEKAQNIFENQMSNWITDVLTPYIAEKFNLIVKTHENELKEITNSVSKISTILNRNILDDQIDDDDVDIDEIDIWQRIVATASGFLTGGVAGAVVGGAVGFDLKNSLYQLMAGFTMVFLGITNPLLLFAAMGTVGGFQAMSSMEKIKNDIKIKTIDVMIENLMEQKDSIISNICTQLEKKLYESFEKLAETHISRKILISQEKVNLTKRNSENTVEQNTKLNQIMLAQEDQLHMIRKKIEDALIENRKNIY